MHDYDFNEPALYKPENFNFPDMTGKVVLMSPTVYDARMLHKAFGFKDQKPKTLFCTNIYTDAPQYPFLVLCSEFMGAPFAAMLVEVLVSKGAKNFLFCGPCGSLNAEMGIGAIFLAEKAFCNEGTSKHYNKSQFSAPDAEYHMVMKAILNTREQRFAHGAMASTDGIFRETLSLVDYFRKKGCCGIDMETSAVFSVTSALNARACSINVISDVFCGNTWQNGFGSDEFKNGRLEAVEIMKEMVVWMHKASQD